MNNQRKGTNRKGRGGASNNNNNNTRNRPIVRNQNNIGRSAINTIPTSLVVSQWFTHTMKPTIPKAQNVYNWRPALTIDKLPGLANLMAMYLSYELISVGARFKGSQTFSQGLYGLLAVTASRAVFLPTGTLKHDFLRKNGCNIVQLSRQASSPPCNNDPSMRKLEVTSATADLGETIWVWEGPQYLEDQPYMGELEVYVNIKFVGLK